ncbi:membrane protein PM19L isoform X2 [Brassica napus]|uniref:membrane protein PM19L isoform X2 n=1 Tax=Brassica napus TaxID=3708 RepID=UPI000BBE22A7|nr:membrane protein PM19L isoform X2 [Brassica napus]
MATVGRNIAAPLLFLNLIMYLIVLGFASWCLNRYINGQTNHPTVIGIASKLAGANHIRFWRNDSLAAAGSSSIVAWAVTALAMGLACKQINIGGWRGWRLRIIEAFIIILTFTQLLYVLLIHAGVFSSKYGPGYRDRDYATGQGHGHVPGTHAGEHKAGVGTTTLAV